MHNEIKKITNKTINFFINTPDKLEIKNPNIVSNQFIYTKIQELFNKTITEKTKTILVKRPTTMNRIQIDWKTPTENEQKLTRQEIADKIVKPCFEQFGKILHLYVCPLNHNRIIIEYANSNSVQNAMVVNEKPRFAVKEFSVVQYYNMTKTEMVNQRYNTINKHIEQLKRSLESYT